MAANSKASLRPTCLTLHEASPRDGDGLEGQLRGPLERGVLVDEQRVRVGGHQRHHGLRVQVGGVRGRAEGAEVELPEVGEEGKGEGKLQAMNNT